ncbi:BRO family protein [Bacillus cereus]
MPQMQTFSHNMFGNVEIFIKDGKEYFPAIDVAKVLEVLNPHDALSKHCKKMGSRFARSSIHSEEHKRRNS